MNAGSKQFRRVLLTSHNERSGPFSKLFGKSEIELVQALDGPAKKIFDGRFWGDLGFIHLCFDMQGFLELEQYCIAANRPFTVNSLQKLNSSFDMGEAAGHFSYIEDPDGALIEFVETHKLPILKKFGWYLDLTKRPHGTRLPDWIIRAMRFSRVKN